MRAREFVESGPTLSDRLRTAIVPPQQPNQNANAMPKGAPAPITSKSPQDYSAGGAGTPTPQDGVPTLPPTGQSNTQGQQSQQPGQPPVDPNKIQPAQLQKLKGQKISVDGLGDVTVGDPVTTPDGPGIKVDASKTPVGAPSMEIPLKNLLGQK